MAVDKNEANVIVNGLKSVAPPAQASFKPVGEGISNFEDPNHPGEIYFQIDKNAKLGVQKFRMPDGRIINIISIPKK